MQNSRDSRESAINAQSESPVSDPDDHEQQMDRRDGKVKRNGIPDNLKQISPVVLIY
jgi:hypothetical protein